MPLYAQELPTNIDNILTTQQLENLKARADQNSVPEGNNLPTSKMPEQKNIKDLKKRNTNDSKDGVDSIDKPLINYYYEILTQEELNIYGQEAFNINENKDLLFYNTPGADYQLAAGDVVRIITRGLSIIDEEAQVDNLGRLTLPIIAPFLAHGKTLEEVKHHVLRELKTEDASASAYITLSAARLVQVKVTGAVNNPQTIAVPAYTPLTQVLSVAGGISNLGSLRNIILTGSNQDRLRIDLYNFLRETDDFKDPLISVSSRIHVNDIGSTVAVAGFVGRPRIFELPYGEHQILTSELMQLANSKLTPSGTTFEVLKFNDKGMVDSTKFNSPKHIRINEGEALRIKFPEIRDLKEAAIEGAVLKPFSIVTSDSGSSLKEALKNGAVLKREAIKRIALIYSNYNQEKSLQIIDLRKILADELDVKIFPGDRVEILDESKYVELLINIENNRLFRDTSLITIDNKVIALIPDYPKQTIASILRSQLFLSKDISRDFAILSSKESGSDEVIKSFNLGKILKESNNTKITNKIEINLFTNQYLSDQLESFDTIQIKNDHLGRIKATNPTEIFIDGNRIGIIPADTILAQTEVIKRLRINKGIYPLFARITDHDQTDSKVTKSFINTDLSQTIFNQTSKSKAGQRYDFFSTEFVRSLFSDVVEDQSSSLEILSSNNEQILAESNINLDKELNSNTEQTENFQTTKYTLAALRRASRLVTGAVENPGFYPIAGEITLSELIDVAGGTLPGSDLTRISIRKYETDAKGVSDISETIIVDATSVDIANIVLFGTFDVTIPNIINNAAVGIVKISGEVLRPGEYIISRDETLTEVIKRAGGLTQVAYPLGLNFARETLMIQERQTNLFLANKLEQSIISLSQNQKEGAGEQINAVLAYAQQLRTLPVNGRQTVNYASLSQTDNIYLEDGDNIFIPKRPSHVTITGRVQNATIAGYEKSKKIEDYINDAGGLDRIADIYNIFVTLPNGQNITQERLKDSNGIIPPGSVIVVPPKTDKLSLLGLTEVFSKVLGNIATSILAINAVSN